MKQILCRAKELKTENWVYGSFIDTYTEWCFIDNGVCNKYTVNRHYVGEFTGLRDKDGTNIYEGDVLKFCDKGYLAEVIWNNEMCAFCLRFSHESHVGERPLGSWLQMSEVVVAGNRWDNPELLE